LFECYTNADDDDHHHHNHHHPRFASIHHVSLEEANTNFHASMVRTIYQKLFSPSPEREGYVAEQGNQKYFSARITDFSIF